jgi:hypothetical protein
MRKFKAAWERFAADETVDLDLAWTVAFLGIIEFDRRGKTL